MGETAAGREDPGQPRAAVRADSASVAAFKVARGAVCTEAAPAARPGRKACADTARARLRSKRALPRATHTPSSERMSQSSVERAAATEGEPRRACQASAPMEAKVLRRLMMDCDHSP